MSQPIQSTFGLTRCPACRAHVRAAQQPSLTVCPFCQANLLTDRRARWIPSGRSALVAASLLAFSAAGCGADESSDPAHLSEPEPAPIDRFEPTPAPDPIPEPEYGLAMDPEPPEPLPEPVADPEPEGEPEAEPTRPPRRTQPTRPEPETPVAIPPYGIAPQQRLRPSAAYGAPPPNNPDLDSFKP